MTNNLEHSSIVLQAITSDELITTIEYRKMFKQKEIYIHRFVPELLGVFYAYQFTSTDILDEQVYVTPLLVLGIVYSFAWTIIKNKKPYIATSLATISTFLFILCGLYIIKMTYFYPFLLKLFYIKKKEIILCTTLKKMTNF